MTTQDAVEIYHPQTLGDRAWLVSCDHASNRVPDWVCGGDLGLPEDQMNRHIAWDIGAAGVARRLADQLGAPALLGRFSRLVIDPNRGEDDPTLIMQLYDGTIVPGNRHLTDTDRRERLNRCYRPYHDTLCEMAAKHTDTILVAIHSFTPKLTSRGPRPWHIGLLSGQDRRMAGPMLDMLRAQGDICVGDNEPYAGHLPGDCVDRHGLQPGRPNVLIELRHDLIESPQQQHDWATRLAPILIRAATIAGL